MFGIWNGAWQNEERLLYAMNNKTKNSGANFMVVSLTEDFRINPASQEGFDYSKPETTLAGLAQKLGFDYIPLLPIFQSRFQTEKTFPHITCDGHWNETGHRWAADAIFDYFKARPELLGLTK
jgi:hypothetical protein